MAEAGSMSITRGATSGHSVFMTGDAQGHDAQPGGFFPMFQQHASSGFPGASSSSSGGYIPQQPQQTYQTNEMVCMQCGLADMDTVYYESESDTSDDDGEAFEPPPEFAGLSLPQHGDLLRYFYKKHKNQYRRFV